MAPCASLPLPPPSPLTAFLEGDGAVHPSNGNDSPTDDIPPVLIAQPKFPGKSNLKRHSMFGSPQHFILQSSPLRHTRSLSGHNDNGLTVSNMMIEKEVSIGEQLPKAAAVGNGVDVVVSTEAYIRYNRRDSRVTWTDNHGKDLAEVWEFEPSRRGVNSLVWHLWQMYVCLDNAIMDEAGFEMECWWSFRPLGNDTNESGEDSDSDSAQGCTCVIQ